MSARQVSTATGTRDDLLDAAERLFAKEGIARTSLRAITAAAGANLASVHYYFGSKEGLVRAVFARRFGPLNRERLELLERCETAEPLRISCLVDAFVAPVLRMLAAEAGTSHFARLVGRALAEPGDRVRELVLEELREVIERFTAAFARALPGVPRREILWRFHFMVGAMAHTAAGADLAAAFSGGVCDPGDVAGLRRRLGQFLTAGWKAARHQAPAATRTRPTAGRGARSSGRQRARRRSGVQR